MHVIRCSNVQVWIYTALSRHTLTYKAENVRNTSHNWLWSSDKRIITGQHHKYTKRCSKQSVMSTKCAAYSTRSGLNMRHCIQGTRKSSTNTMHWCGYQGDPMDNDQPGEGVLCRKRQNREITNLLFEKHTYQPVHVLTYHRQKQ